MAKPDLFRVLGCVVMVTLILVIAVKLSKQCMHAVPKLQKASPSTTSASPSSALDYPSVKQGHGVCEAGFRPDQNGFCVNDY
jgi:hypothetical protein